MSRRLHALHVGNFKAFADTQRIPLKPITLVFGPNSSGKSSFIHSLALAHEALFGRDKQGRARLDVHHTEVGGSAIDLGGYRQFVHRGQLRNSVVWGAEIRAERLKEDPNFHHLAGLLSPVDTLQVFVRLGIKLNKFDRPTNDSVPRVDSIEIRADDEDLLYMARRDEVGSALRILRFSEENPVLRQLVRAIIEGYTTTTEMRVEDFSPASEAISGLLPEMVVRMGAFLPTGVELPQVETADSPAAQMFFPVSKGNRAEDIAQAIRFQMPRSLNDLVKGITEVLAGELHGFRYLGPLRDVPPRHVAFQQHQDENWVSGGKFAWELLRKDEALREKVNQWLAGHPGKSNWGTTLDAMEKEVPVKTWMKTPYRLEIARFYSAGDLKDPLIRAFMKTPLTLEQRRELLTGELAEVEHLLQYQYELDQAQVEEELAQLRPWRDKIEAARSNEEREAVIAEALRDISYQREINYVEAQADQAADEYEEALGKSWEFVKSLEQEGDIAISELRLMDVNKRTPVSLRDVGVGISQVLPVLALAYGSRQQLVAIEQPEIHLHPALQAELGDVFIEAALGENKNTFILETHSEHLILRLLRRVREGVLSPDDVAVLYVQPTGTESKVLEIRVDEDGDFIDRWPGGFFEESFREREAGR